VGAVAVGVGQQEYELDGEVDSTVVLPVRRLVVVVLVEVVDSADRLLTVVAIAL
jgi:hypothetical protein